MKYDNEYDYYVPLTSAKFSLLLTYIVKDKYYKLYCIT